MKISQLSKNGLQLNIKDYTPGRQRVKLVFSLAVIYPTSLDATERYFEDRRCLHLFETN